MNPSLLAVIVIGPVLALTACGGDPRESDEYAQVSSALQTAKKDASAEAERLQAEIDAANAELERTVGDLPEREDRLRQSLVKLDEKRLELEAKAEALDTRAKKLAKRERAVGIVEARAAANTIPGDGVYRVPQDMNAGTYRSIDNSDCYWQLSSDANGENIIQNNIVTGPALVTVSPGQYFTTSRCGDWIKQ